jgi:murein tripeptide amidase MpaA
VSSAFDGGNAEVVDASRPDAVRLRIRPDVGGRFLQWFHFRVSGCRETPLVLRLENAGAATYEDGYVDYRAVASTDRTRWRRVPTEFDGEVLTIRHTPDADSVWYAYFAPYPMTRHADLVARCQRDPRVTLEVLGATLDGQDLDHLRVGEGAVPVWVIARQHPGETMAEHWMEGFLDRLLDRADPVARALLRAATFHVVPNMNPDGSRRGHLRTNAVGANLNRAWQRPSMERTPEVFLVRERMHRTGVGLCLDVHGDEELPYNFIAGPDGIPSLTERQRAQLARFRTTLAALSPDFQTEHGYPPSAPGEANLSLCTNYVAEAFGCLAMTLEQPFKDAANHPDPDVGWSPARCRHLARSCLDALWATRDDWTA